MTSASGISNPTFFSGPSDKLSGSEDMTERKDIPYKNLTGTDDDKISVISDEGELQCSTSESSLSENSVDIPTAKEREAKSTKRSSSGSDSAKSIKKESSDGKSLENIQDHESVESKKAKKTSSKFIVMMVLSAFTAIFGVAMLAGGYDALFDSILQSQMEVKPGSQAYDIWKDTPVPLTISFYLFNLTNPVEFSNGGRPMVDEIGPYVYREYHKKTNLEFHENATVSFYQQRWWVWDQEASGNLSEDDPICILNTVPVSAAYSSRDHPFQLTGLNMVLNQVNETLTGVFPARQILFDGYQDPLLDYVQRILNNESRIPPEALDLLDLPDGLLNYDRMGWFYKRNLSETYDGWFNMFTGTDTLDHVGNIDWWNQIRETDYYHEGCNQIFGSAGEIWPPGQSATSISFYCTDMCSTLTLRYKEDVMDEFGLEGYRYWADNMTFASADVAPENLCYCFTNDTCPPSGLLDAETCRMGAPAFISFPHFLHGDPSLAAAIDGLLPADEERDQLYIDMIPELGVPISVRARMQLNMAVVPYKSLNFLGLGRIDILAKVKEVILPLIWFEVSAGLTEELAKDLKPVMFLLHTPTMTIIWSLLVVCGVCGFGAVLFWWKR